MFWIWPCLVFFPGSCLCSGDTYHTNQSRVVCWSAVWTAVIVLKCVWSLDSLSRKCLRWLQWGFFCQLDMLNCMVNTSPQPTTSLSTSQVWGFFWNYYFLSKICFFGEVAKSIKKHHPFASWRDWFINICALLLIADLWFVLTGCKSSDLLSVAEMCIKSLGLH